MVYLGRGRRRALFVLSLMTGAGLLAPRASGQGCWGPNPGGYWAGPWTLGVWGDEITHAALLPPRWPTTPSSWSYANSVMLMVKPGPPVCNAPPWTPGTTTFVWNPSNPGAVTPKPVGNTASQDFW